KSTLMGVLTNHNQPQGGHITLNGKLLNKYKPKELAKALGVVHQKNVAPEDMTVEKLVYYGRLPYKSTFSTVSEQDDEKVTWEINFMVFYVESHIEIYT